MQAWHEIFQTLVESKVDGFIPIADKGNSVHYIFKISYIVIAAHIFVGSYHILWQRAEIRTWDQPCGRQARKPMSHAMHSMSSATPLAKPHFQMWLPTYGEEAQP